MRNRVRRHCAQLNELLFTIPLYSLVELFRASLQAPLLKTTTNEQVRLPAATEDP